MNGIIPSVMKYISSSNIPNQLGREYILDPLSTIIKLAILGFKSDMSKIAIRYNSIYIQDASLYQSTVRYLYGDSKEFLHYLKEPIAIACNHYLSTDFELHEELSIVFRLALKGLQKLKDTYDTQRIILNCLEYYELIINSYLDKSNLKDTFHVEKARDEYSDKLVSSLLEYWNVDNINIVVNLFENLDRKKDFNLIKVIETFMVSVDATINYIVINSC